jgi:hypothetical protein
VNIAVGSAFRNFSARVQPYFERVADLQTHAGKDHTVRVIAVEGDSRDDTRGRLDAYASYYRVPTQVVTCNHGQREFGSTEDVDRMVALSRVGNAIFNAVAPTDDVLLYVEADLLWDAHTAGSLIDLALRREDGFDVVAPMIMCAPTIFYDVWGFRVTRDERFAPFKPYHPSLMKDALNSVYSVGSCLAMRGEVARDVRIENDYCLVGWCERARERGYAIAVHTGFEVFHP